jgi:hypothetical protein
MGMTVSPGQIDLGTASLSDDLTSVLQRHLTDLRHKLGHSAGRQVAHWRKATAAGHHWSLADMVMVIAWIAAMPNAASRFQHDILAPPVSGLSPAEGFLVAAAVASLELSCAAMLGRLLAGVVREAVMGLARRSSGQRRPALTPNCRPST